ncbi:MAG: HEAT repeat domain-containing protein [Microcystis aeruginosa Ma_MB_F_20061100_S20]|uniref:HEAT repeat domain-containing protein n=1 Tax=Microcystis aeruginosa Ma_MB_F_20061100_S20D TaxID=2486253 RepID=A0A552EPX0_MICAE|nr:MAG: HEAT repeat domain-containing protein [Microcystis aeruginosa Ma_MB_F_20061100_S20D]TRU42169.1 MAG: HEAT repeat domain-containing protein [Microcystis aeruginosa Ma_MB_F_20061100_S20]
MIKPNFLLLLAIGVSSWGHDFQVLSKANAQTSPGLGQTQTFATYEQLMKAGYEAKTQKNYQLALEKFQQALVQLPNDPSAQNAIANTQKHLGQTTRAANAGTENAASPIPLIAGSALLSIALLAALLSLFFQYRPKDKASKRREKTTYANPKNPLDNFSRGNGNPFGADTKTGSDINGSGDEDFDPSLPVQATSRIPNVDLILRLIESLRDNDPRTRRRAVWKLAQVSDSRAMQPLVDSMVDGDSYERSLTLEALAQICTRSLRPMNQALAISLQDKNPQVRKNAIRDLTRLYDIMSQISQLICHALDDPDEEVQETARWAVRQLNLQLAPRLDIAPLETTGEPEDDDVQDTSFTETTPTFTETTPN